MPKPLKEWRLDEAERCGVHERTIDTWKSLGYYSHLKFKRVNRRVVMVSGRPKKPREKAVFVKRYDWSKADWSKKDTEIAAQLGCHRSAVTQARMRFGK